MRNKQFVCSFSKSAIRGRVMYFFDNARTSGIAPWAWLDLRGCWCPELLATLPTAATGARQGYMPGPEVGTPGKPEPVTVDTISYNCPPPGRTESKSAPGRRVRESQTRSIEGAG